MYNFPYYASPELGKKSHTMEYTKVVQKGSPDFYYMKGSLEFDKGVYMKITDVEMKAAILKALKILHGLVGQAIPVDILKYNERSKGFILRVPQSGFTRLRTALALFGKYDGEFCAFRIHQVSAHLMALAVNSREEMFSPVPSAIQ